MEPAQKMSESEMEVMEAVWAFDGPVTSAQVQERLSARGWKPTTVLTFLSRLTEKGLLAREKNGKLNHYVPLLTSSEYKEWETRSFLNEVHGGSLRSFFAALSGGEKLTEADVEELKHWLDEQ